MAVGEDDQQRHHRDQGSAPCRGAAGGACAAGVLEAAAHSCPRRYRRRLAESTSWQLATDKPGPGVTSHAFDRPSSVASRCGGPALRSWLPGVPNHAAPRLRRRTTQDIRRRDVQARGLDAGLSASALPRTRHVRSKTTDSWMPRPQSTNTPRCLRGTAPMAMTKCQSDSRSSASPPHLHLHLHLPPPTSCRRHLRQPTPQRRQGCSAAHVSCHLISATTFARRPGSLSTRATDL